MLEICMSCVCCCKSQRALDSSDIIFNILMMAPLTHLSNDVTFIVLYCYSHHPTLFVPFCKLLKITRFTNYVTKEDIGQ